MQSPSHDRAELNYKMDYLHDKEKPPTFYGHEGRYNEERAGRLDNWYLLLAFSSTACFYLVPPGFLF